jgi:ACT domain-containing protein
MRAIITAYGQNRIGILGEITALVGKFQMDVRDISQKIMDEYFTMIMLVDLTKSPVSIAEASKEFKKLGEKLHLVIEIQHEDVFKAMHRI